MTETEQLEIEIMDVVTVLELMDDVCATQAIINRYKRTYGNVPVSSNVYDRLRKLVVACRSDLRYLHDCIHDCLKWENTYG